MTPGSSHAAFSGSVPRTYHEHLGPMFFVPYARDLARRVPTGPGIQVLEIACGTGILTGELVAALGTTADITSTDLNDAMIAVAKSHVASDRVRWQTADATSLPFDHASFDVVVCQFGCMFFPDKAAAAREVRRVLRPGGVFLFNVWGTLAENPIAAVTNDVIGACFASDPPGFYQVPFGYADRDRIAEDLRAGGFTRLVFDTVEIEGRSPSAEHAAVGLVQGTPVVNAIRERGTVSPEEVTRAVAAALERRFGAGEIHIPQRAHVVTARP